MFLRGKKFPDEKTIMQSAWLGFVMISFSSGLSHWSVQYISGGLAAIIGATIPLWIAIFSIAAKKDRKVSLQVLIGLLLGFAGILIIFYDHLAELLNKDFRLGIMLAAVSCITWAAGSVYTSKIKLGTGLLFGAGLQMFFAGIFVTVASIFFRQTVSLVTLPKETWFCMFYLIIIGSIVTYSSYVYVVQNLPTEKAGVYAYINPIVTLVLGRLLLDERLNYMIAIGALVTIFGVYLVNSNFRKNQLKQVSEKGNPV